MTRTRQHRRKAPVPLLVTAIATRCSTISLLLEPTTSQAAPSFFSPGRAPVNGTPLSSVPPILTTESFPSSDGSFERANRDVSTCHTSIPPTTRPRRLSLRLLSALLSRSPLRREKCRERERPRDRSRSIETKGVVHVSCIVIGRTRKGL